MGSFSGGANVKPATGEPLTFDDPSAVPANVYCLDKIHGDDNEVGLIIGRNVDVRASRLQIERTQLGAIQAGGTAANVATVASGCPDLEGACRTAVQELACPACKQGGVNFLVTASSGLTALTRLTMAQSVLGLDAQGVASGLNPFLTDPDHPNLTIARRPRSLFKTPVLVGQGPDSKLKPELVSLTLAANNIGVKTAAISIENRDSVGGQLNITPEGNCYTPDGSGCISRQGEQVVAAAGTDSEVTALNTTALKQAAKTLQPAGLALDCTAITPSPNPANPTCSGSNIDALLLKLCEDTLTETVGPVASDGFKNYSDHAGLLSKPLDAAIKIDQGKIVEACSKINDYDDKLASLPSTGSKAKISQAAKAKLEAASDAVIACIFEIAASQGLTGACEAVLVDN